MSLIEFIIVSLCFGIVLIIGCAIGSIWFVSLSLFNPKVWLICFVGSPFILLAYIFLVVVLYSLLLKIDINKLMKRFLLLALTTELLSPSLDNLIKKKFVENH